MKEICKAYYKFREQNNQQGDEVAGNVIENQSILGDKKDVIREEDKEEDEENVHEEDTVHKVDEADIEAEYEKISSSSGKEKGTTET